MTVQTANAELDRVLGGDYGRSPIGVSAAPAPLPPVGSEIQRLTVTAYRAGVDAGHSDGLAHLEPMIRDCRGELLFARQRRNQSHRESPDFRVWTDAAERERGHLQRLLFIRRALKGATQ